MKWPSGRAEDSAELAQVPEADLERLAEVLAALAASFWRCSVSPRNDDLQPERPREGEAS